MAARKKQNFPVDRIRHFMEPGPIVLVSSAHKGERNIMTMGWHMVLEQNAVGCFIWDQNHSRDLIRKSRECVINVPTADMAKTVVAIGNCSGRETDKFATFGLTPVEADKVGAPLIGECHANLECRLVDTSMIRKYSLFVFEVVKAHAVARPRFPETMHYHGEGMFSAAGRTLDMRKHFRPDMLKA